MAVEESYCNLASGLSVAESLNFNYDELDNETRCLVGQRTKEIRSLIHRSAQDIFDIGKNLIEVKEKLGHGRFLIWLNAEFNWSQSAARKFMQVARQFKMVNFTDLNIATSALYLLASNSVSFAVRQEVLERATQGEIIDYSEAKLIIAQHKKTDNSNLLKQVTVDVSAEIVDEGAISFIQQKVKYSESEDTDFKQLRQRAKQLGLLRQNLDEQASECLHPIAFEAVKTCTKLIDTIEDLDFQLLESMEDEALKVLINKSKLLTKRAKILLTHRSQLSKIS